MHPGAGRGRHTDPLPARQPGDALSTAAHLSTASQKRIGVYEPNHGWSILVSPVVERLEGSFLFTQPKCITGRYDDEPRKPRISQAIGTPSKSLPRLVFTQKLCRRPEPSRISAGSVPKEIHGALRQAGRFWPIRYPIRERTRKLSSSVTIPCMPGHAFDSLLCRRLPLLYLSHSIDGRDVLRIRSRT